jgi:nucleoid-associated protein YgaU
VAKDDSFWKIAARSDTYGNGIHYKLIAAANPGANSSSLQPGDKLVIPPLAASATGVGAPSAVTPDPIVATGERIYVVQSGDSGMWGISKSQYGDGKYYPAISRKNPGVNPSRLKIGQKIILPSLEQAKAFLGGSSARSPAPSGAVGGSSSGVTPAPIPVRTPIPVPPPVAPVGGDGEPDFS